MRLRHLAPAALLVGVAALLLVEPALAQARNPFSVGISEGGGPTTGLMGWILSQQGYFERALSAAVRASRTDRTALPWLAGLSFVYGVLHAAGPGHGKAVLASYMVANRRALRRGIVLSFLAALLQAAVAVALVGVLSLVFRATAIGMRDGAALIEKVSYVGVAALGLWLTWRKGAGFLAAWREWPRAPAGFAPAFAFAGTKNGPVIGNPYRLGAPACVVHEPVSGGRSSFACTVEAGAATHLHGPNCGHFHAPDPSMLGESFSWREAISTVVAAGARPCSGAILVLVFSLAQGIFYAGIAATIVMALGTAITTAALASIAVLAKGVALRLAGAEPGRGAIVARGLELLAALVVLAVGLSLLFGVGPLQGLA
ncbi:MAG: nickel/cobalt transporter [Janthinobacterium lividum]